MNRVLVDMLVISARATNWFFSTGNVIVMPYARLLCKKGGARRQAVVADTAEELKDAVLAPKAEYCMPPPTSKVMLLRAPAERLTSFYLPVFCMSLDDHNVVTTWVILG